jgi:hypothetical protein
MRSQSQVDHIDAYRYASDVAHDSIKMVKSEGAFLTRADVIRGCDDETLKVFGADPTTSCVEHLGMTSGACIRSSEARKEIEAYFRSYLN